MEHELIRGDSAVIEFSVKEDITLNDIETLTLTARPYADGDILFTKSKKDFTLEDHTFSVEILPEDTQELLYKKFDFDIEIVLNDKTTSSLIGTVNIVKDYTTHTSGGVDNEN